MSKSHSRKRRQEANRAQKSKVTPAPEPVVPPPPAPPPPQPETKPVVQPQATPAPVPQPPPALGSDYTRLVKLLGKRSTGDELKALATALSAHVKRHRAGKHESGIAFEGAGLWFVTDGGIITGVFIELREPEQGYDAYTGNLGCGTTQQQCREAMEKINARFIDSGKAPQRGGTKFHTWERYSHDETQLIFNFDHESGKMHNLSILLNPRTDNAACRPSGTATCEQILQSHLSPAAQTVLARAKQEARRLDHDEIGTEQLLIALLSTDGSITQDLCHQFNLNAIRARTEVDKLLVRGQGKAEFWLSPRLRSVIMLAWDEACRLSAKEVDDTHLLLALLRLRSGFAIRVLEDLGIDLDDLQHALLTTMG